MSFFCENIHNYKRKKDTNNSINTLKYNLNKEELKKLNLIKYFFTFYLEIISNLQISCYIESTVIKRMLVPCTQICSLLTFYQLYHLLSHFPSSIQICTPTHNCFWAIYGKLSFTTNHDADSSITVLMIQVRQTRHREDK